MEIMKKVTGVSVVTVLAYMLLACYWRPGVKIVYKDVEKVVVVSPEPGAVSTPVVTAVAPEGDPPLPLSEIEKLSCPLTELPPGSASCSHAHPSIEDSLSYDKDDTNPWMDVCSWWGDMPGGRIPAKRLMGSIGAVPPRATCWSDRVCIAGEKLCLGHQNDPEDNPLQFCPHHDGPLRVSLKACEASVGCAEQHHPTCSEQTGPGSGRTILMITEHYLLDGSNVWHVMNTLLDIFGSIVRADPGLVDGEGVFHPTSARLTLMLQTLGFHHSRQLRKAHPWGPQKGGEMKELLESFTACPLDLPNPAEEQCYTNVVMGTPHNVYLQWEDKVAGKGEVELAKAFARHLVSHYFPNPAEVVNANVPSPWDRVYGEREKPKLLLMMRGEGVRENKRQMVGAEHLVSEAGQVGFDVVKLDADGGTTLKAQIEVIASADVLVGVHGAGLGWAMVLPPHGVLVEMRPSPSLVDRTFIYPGLAATRGLAYIEWHQTEPITPSADPRLPLDTTFTIAQPAAAYYAAKTRAALSKSAPWFRPPSLWHKE